MCISIQTTSSTASISTPVTGDGPGEGGGGGFFTGPRCPPEHAPQIPFHEARLLPPVGHVSELPMQAGPERASERASVSVCESALVKRVHVCLPRRSNWLKPCCGRRVALWQVCLLSAGFNCVLVACVLLVVLFLSLELLIDTKLLQCKYQRAAAAFHRF